MATREQQKRQTRQAFFTAVLKVCMSGQSFSAISLRQITREVGVVPTAFYRHFSDMDDLGASLVLEALGTALAQLREHLEVGKKRTFDRQIAISVERFFKAIDEHPQYWQFIVSERYGGNIGIQNALEQQIRLFTELLGEDLGLQPAFSDIPQAIRLLIAEMGVTLFFSWVYGWLKINNYLINELSPTSDTQKSDYLKHCTQQAQLLFYGVSNWRENPG